MRNHFLITIEPFLVRANTREEAYEIARTALPGAQLNIVRLGTERELNEHAEYLRRNPTP